MRQLKRTVKIGNITIGGTNPIAVQTMLNVPVKDIAGNVEQAKRVAKAGCQIVRVTVPTPADAAVVSAIKEAVDIPVVADIHFDYRLAIAAAMETVENRKRFTHRSHSLRSLSFSSLAFSLYKDKCPFSIPKTHSATTNRGQRVNMAKKSKRHTGGFILKKSPEARQKISPAPRH